MTLEGRIELANSILKTFSNSYRLRFDKGFMFSWQDWRGQQIEKRWSASPNFYPTFHRKLAVGGTQAIAIAQLVRYCQGKPVLPLTTWQHWASPTVNLWPDIGKRQQAIATLENSDWPKRPVCIFCGKEFLSGGWDWYSIPEEGPGCYGGCKREGDRPSIHQ